MCTVHQYNTWGNDNADSNEVHKDDVEQELDEAPEVDTQDYGKASLATE